MKKSYSARERKSLKPGDIVVIRWADSHGSGTWKDEEEARDMPLYVRSVGAVVYNGRNCLCISTSRAKNEDWLAPVKIPWPVIVELEVIGKLRLD